MGIWIEHKDYPIALWKEDVANNRTRLGYWDWVDSQLEAKPQQQQPSVVEAVDYE